MAVRQMLVAGRYRLLEPVGAGGMGRVWLARDEMLHRDVAVKEIVPPDWMTDEEKNRQRARTLREARSAARLNHPHVVRIYDVVHAAGLSWIVMEYVPSRSLHQVLYDDGPYDPAVAARIGLAVLDALAAAHRAGVLHRDVKPHNVLIGTDGRVVLTDFGLATFVDDGSVTAPGLIVGSPQYVSPERARDGASTVESDLWSLGATLYAAVEGRSPYARETAMATLAALATEPPDPPVRAGPLTAVLDGLLRYEPATRLTVPEIERRLRMIVFADPREIPFLPSQRDPRQGRPAGRRGHPADRDDSADRDHAGGRNPPATPAAGDQHSGSSRTIGDSEPNEERSIPAASEGSEAGGPATDPGRSPGATRDQTPHGTAARPSPRRQPTARQQHPHQPSPRTPRSSPTRKPGQAPARQPERKPSASESPQSPPPQSPPQQPQEQSPVPKPEPQPQSPVSLPLPLPLPLPLALPSPQSQSSPPETKPVPEPEQAAQQPSPEPEGSRPESYQPDPRRPVSQPPAEKPESQPPAGEPENQPPAVEPESQPPAGGEATERPEAVPTEPNSAVIRDGEPASEQVESGSTEDGRELLDPLAAVVTVESETTRLPHEPGRALVLAAPAPGLGIPGRDLQRSRAPRRRATVRLTQARLTVAGLVVLLLAGGLLTGYVVRVNEARPQVFLPSPSSTSASLVPAPSSERVQAPISPGPGVVSPTDMPGSSAGAGGETASSAASAEVPATTAVSPGTPAAAGSGAAPATASPPTPSATAAAPLEAFSPALCDSPPPGGLPVTPQKGAPRGVNGWTLQAGWSYFNDGAGFHLAVPDGWTYQRIGTTYCFRSPRNARVMSLDAGRDPAADPLAASRAEERRLAESAALPGYALVGVAPVPLLHKAADWEYRYRSRTGAARHTGVRWFVVAGRAYALGWSTPEKSWATDLSKIQMIRSTFYSDRPAPGPDRSTPSS